MSLLTARLGGWAAGLALALVGASALAFPVSPYAAPRASTMDPGYATVAETWTGTAACLTAQDASLGARLAPLFDGRGVDAQVVGFDLRDQPAPMVEAFRALTKRLDRDIATGKAQPKVSSCQDVACAMTELVGPELAPRMLLLAVGYGYMASDLGARADQRWTARELDVVLAALADLPDSWFASDTGTYRVLLHRQTEAAARVGALASNGGFLVALAGEGYPGILIADGWDRIGARERRVVMVHELAHELVRTAPARWHRDWRRAMKADRAAGRKARAANSVSVYADTDPGEDFAESVAAYRYLPALLKRRAPARYAFLKDRVFDGVDYASEAACRAPVALPTLRIASAGSIQAGR